MTAFRVVIPARYASQRLPGKPLLDIAGKPMIRHVYDRACESGAEEVVIATDDARIQAAAGQFTDRVCMTSSEHTSGTDRIAEVVRVLQWPDDTVVVNLQGDEPLMPPALLAQVAETLESHAESDMATLAVPLTDPDQLFDTNAVKVVADRNGYALYFSRATIPWKRDLFDTGCRGANALAGRRLSTSGHLCVPRGIPWRLCQPAGIADRAHGVARTAAGVVEWRTDCRGRGGD